MGDPHLEGERQRDERIPTRTGRDRGAREPPFGRGETEGRGDPHPEGERQRGGGLRPRGGETERWGDPHPEGERQRAEGTPTQSSHTPQHACGKKNCRAKR